MMLSVGKGPSISCRLLTLSEQSTAARHFLFKQTHSFKQSMIFSNFCQLIAWSSRYQRHGVPVFWWLSTIFDGWFWIKASRFPFLWFQFFTSALFACFQQRLLQLHWCQHLPFSNAWLLLCCQNWCLGHFVSLFLWSSCFATSSTPWFLLLHVNNLSWSIFLTGGLGWLCQQCIPLVWCRQKGR